MKACFFLVVILCLMCGVSRADVIHLKNGNSVEGKVVEKTADGIKVDIGGVMLTYYSDEVASIDSADQPVVSTAPAAEAEASAPVAAVTEAPALEPVAEIAAEAPAAEPIAEPAVEVPMAEPVAASDDLTNMSKEDLIKKFVQIYGVKENMQTNFDQMTATLKPDQAEAFRQSVKVDEIVDLLLPIYDKHFSADDLRAYIRFYSSAEGRKLVQTLPLLMKDSVDISMKYLDERLPESLKQAEAAPSGN
jgi:hypothetical protein